MRSHALITGSGLCTNGRCQHCRNKLHWKLLPYSPVLQNTIPKGQCLGLAGPFSKEGVGEPHIEGRTPYPYPTSTPGSPGATEHLHQQGSSPFKPARDRLALLHTPVPALPISRTGRRIFLSLTYIHKHFQLGLVRVFQIFLRAVVLVLATAPGDAPLAEVFSPLPVRIVLHPAAVQLEGEAHLGSLVAPEN